MRHLRLPSALLACSALLLSCDSADNPIAPSGSVLTIAANPTQIGLNGTATLTVTGFKPDGNPLNPGTQINLSTTLGVLAETLIEVANGRASTTLRGDGRSGTATVTATLPGGGETSATVDVLIGQTAETQPTLSITVSPNVIALNESAQVTALARNADGSLFGAGGRVNLRTDLGSLVGQAGASCGSSGSSSVNIQTGSDSQALATLCPGSIVGTATITGSVESSAEATATVQIGRTAETQPTLVLDANPQSINLGQQSTISAIARAADGSPLTNAEILLRTSLGQLGNTTPTTDSNGEAQTTLFAGNQSGEAVVTGSVGSSAETSVTVTVGQPVLTISANPSDIRVEETSTITVIARGTNGVPLPNQTILLTADLGTLDDDRPRTDADGVATAIFTAGTRAGTGRVTAILGTSEQVSVDIDIRDFPTDFTLQVSDTTIPSGGGSIDITVTVVNAEGDGLQNILVRFNTEGVGGSFDPGNAILTDSRGVAETTLTLTETQLENVQTFDVTAQVTTQDGVVTKRQTITVRM